MSVVVVPTGHFSGQRAITHNPTGDDTRDLRELINEVVAQANTNETDISTNAASIIALGVPLDYKGAIAAAADFPTAVLVEDGWMYLISADVIDNDATKTNTGDAFKAGDEVVWNGTDWTRLGRKVRQLTAGNSQDTAVTATTFQFMASRAGKINYVSAKAATTAAAGEDMAVDVTINTTSCLTAVISLDDAAGILLQAGSVDPTADDFVAGDIIEIVRTYTAGGTPTPMTGTSVAIDYEEELLT